jgi:hypothetical protein
VKYRQSINRAGFIGAGKWRFLQESAVEKAIFLRFGIPGLTDF